MTAHSDRFDRYNAQCSDIQGHLGFMANFVVDNNLTVLVECGVRTGVSTAAWLAGLERTGGHLWSVDVDPAPYDAEDWTFIQGSDLDPEVIAQLPENPELVFIDTCHTFEHTCAEIETYREIVRPGGWMFFHDTDSGPQFGVRPALDHMWPGGWSNRGGSGGLGVWQRPL